MSPEQAVKLLKQSTDSEVVEAARCVGDYIDRNRKVLKAIAEALTELKLDMKYIVFDLEATRRERDCLYAQLNGQQFRNEEENES